MSKSTEERVEYALSQLLERLLPTYPDEDESAANERFDEAFTYAIDAIGGPNEPSAASDVNHASDLIKKKLVRENKTPEKALKFSNLYSRLLTQPVLNHKWAMLYFLYRLSEDSYTSPLPSPDHRQPRQYSVEPPVFNDAFSTNGLRRLPIDPNPPQPIIESKPDRVREKKIASPIATKTVPVNEEAAVDVPAKVSNTGPSESALLRDLPFTLQGLSSAHLVFASSKILTLPSNLPVPMVSLLHTLAEPSLLYRRLSEFVDSAEGGLVGQSLRSALGKELRSYLGLVASLEGQIRRALVMLDDSQPRQGLGKAGVTLKRCVVWTREATMGLRLMSVMVEESRGKKGGELISLIHSFSLTHGDPFVRSFAERLLSDVTRPFYNMLRQWIYDGELSDPFLEFFVSEQKDIPDDDTNPDGKKGGATSVWEDKYKLDSRMIPSIITEEFANKVFLIGKTLNFIRHGCGDASWVESYSKRASKELQYGDTADLEKSIGEAYKSTMARLIYLMAEKFKLFEHLQALKKFLLLGAGDFVAILMESLSENLNLPANSQYRHTLTAQLEHAVRNSNAQFESPEVLRRLDARMLELSHGEIGWDVFTLEYKIDAPVDVIVTPFGSKQYLKVFNFLWRVKRVEFELSRTWRQCMTGARGVLSSVEHKLGSDWKRARCAIAEMIHFVNQLQYYILFEVIESSWNDLQAAMHKPERTLDDLIEAHAQYLTAITRKGLLGSSTADFTGQLHELIKIMLSYKDAVGGLWSFSVAEFSRLRELDSKIETRTAAGKWGISERDSRSNVSTPIAGSDDRRGARAAAETETPFKLFLGRTGEDDMLPALRKRLSTLSTDFTAKVNILLGDLVTQPDADMRWLAMVMNFNDTYHPRKRRRNPATGTIDKKKERAAKEDSKSDLREGQTRRERKGQDKEKG